MNEKSGTAQRSPKRKKEKERKKERNIKLNKYSEGVKEMRIQKRQVRRHGVRSVKYFDSKTLKITNYLTLTNCIKYLMSAQIIPMAEKIIPSLFQSHNLMIAVYLRINS